MKITDTTAVRINSRLINSLVI